MSKKIYIRVDKPIEVGDLVRCVEYDDECKPGDVRKVSRMNERYKTIFYVHGSGRPLSKDFWEPVRKEVKMSENRRAEMGCAVAEMIVELLDQEGKERIPSSSVYIANWRDLDNTVTVIDDGNKSHDAHLSPNDTWDTLTGVFVALSKATGHKLPDWIYIDEAIETETTGCHYCRGIESHDIVAIKTVLDEYSRMISAYDTPYNYCPNCGRKIRKD